MIRCTKCQTINSPDAIFCSNCASFLEWTGEKVEPSELAAREPPAAPSEPAVEAQEPPTPAREGGPPVPDSQPAAAPAPPAAESRVELQPAPAPDKPLPPSEPISPPAGPEPEAETPPRKPGPTAATPPPPSPPPEAPKQAEFRYRAAAPPAPPSSDKAVSPRLPTEPPAATGQPPARPATQPGSQPPPRPPTSSTEPAPRRPQPSGASGQPPSRQPGTVVPPPRRVSGPPTPPAEPELRPGDLICSRCGTGNDPARRFCRRCGNSLAMAVVAQRPPWYRRLFGRKRALAAGQRPERMGRHGRSRVGVLKPLLVLVLLAVPLAAVGAYIGLPDFKQRIDSVGEDLRLTFMPRIERIQRSDVAGEGRPNHPPAAAVDDNTLTYWLVEQASGGPLRVTFSETFDLGGLVFHSGSSTGSDFVLHRRPRNVELRFPGTTQAPVRIALSDESDPQSHALDVRDVRIVELRIVNSYVAGAGGDDLIAVREIEFMARR